MLLAEESTQVAEQNQDGRLAKQFASVEDLAIGRHQIEVEIDPHRTMMRAQEGQSVICSDVISEWRTWWSAGMAIGRERRRSRIDSR
jgi:hypothetical protein